MQLSLSTGSSAQMIRFASPNIKWLPPLKLKLLMVAIRSVLAAAYYHPKSHSSTRVEPHADTFLGPPDKSIPLFRD
jgi:hypothetical protein